MCKLSIPNDKFISMNSPFQKPDLFSSLRDVENNFEFFDVISKRLNEIALHKNLNDKKTSPIEAIDDTGIRILSLHQTSHKRKDKFSLPVEQIYSIYIYFYVDTLHDLSYMFNIVFNDGYKSIGFELCPRDCAEYWTDKNIETMDILGDMWSRNQKRIAYIKEHEVG